MKNLNGIFILTSLLILPCYAFSQDSIAAEIGMSVEFEKAHSIHKNVYGVNNYIATRPYYSNQSGFISKYEDLGKPCIRYPGGTFSNYYNFETGFAAPYDGMSEADSINRVAGPNNSILKYKASTGGEDYRKFCDFVRKTGAEFSLSLNIILHTAEENRALFQGFKDEGVEIKKVEMGNELYFGEYDIPVPDVEKYIELAKANAVVLHEVFADAKVGVLCPSHIYTHESFLDEVDEGVTSRQTHWFEKLQEEHFYDAMVIHMYSTVGMDSDVPASEFIPYEEAYKYSISHADGKYHEAVEALREAYPGKEVWVTEYHHGGFGGDVGSYRLRYAYLGGFFTAQFMMKIFNTPEMTLGSWHSLVQWLGFSSTSTLLPDNYNFSTLVNYHVFKLFKEPVAQSENIAPVTFSGQKKYQGVGEYTGVYDDLEGSLFYSGNKAWMIIFNKLEQTYIVSEDSLLAGLTGLDGARLESVKEFGPSESMNLHEGLNSETAYSSGTVSADSGYYTLKPYRVYTFSFSHLTLDASAPDPAVGQVVFTDSLNLAWLPGYLSDSSDVYFGFSEGAMLNAGHDSPEYRGRYDTNTYYPGPLLMDTTYFWRIDAVSKDTSVKGSVWNFTTVGDTTPVVYHASLVLQDISKGTVIYRATFTYGSEVVLSNKDGKINFEFTNPLQIDFIAEHDQYFPVEGSVLLSGNTSLVIPMTAKIANIIFQITDNQGPLGGVKVSLNGLPLLTNSSGQTMFLSRQARKMYGYSLEMDGFTTYADSLWLETDTTLQINFQTLGIDETGISFIQIFPNPTRGTLNIETVVEQARLDLLSPSGKIFMSTRLQTGNNKLDISSLPPGLYLIRIETAKKQQYSKLIKSF